MTQPSTTLMPFFTVVTAARGLTVNSGRLVVRGPRWMPTCGSDGSRRVGRLVEFWRRR
jgi:hypothetical protein